jgi:uncharacterized protein YciI
MFVAVSEYDAPLAEVDALRPAHQEWVAGHYRAGTILVSGRREPPRGGVIVAAADSDAAMRDLLEDDPFVAAGVARYHVHGFRPADGELRSDGFRRFAEAVGP